jgi:hypothetical protein
MKIMLIWATVALLSGNLPLCFHPELTAHVQRILGELQRKRQTNT